MAKGNSIMDEIKEQQRKLEGRSFKEKVSYFFFYYKLQTLIVVVAIIFLAVFIRDIAMQKDTVFSAIYINSFPNVEDEDFIVKFDTFAGLDTNKQESSFDTSFYLDDTQNSQYVMASTEKIMAMVAASSLDVCVADEDSFKTYAKQGFYLDLSTVLSESQLADYKNRILYYDVPDDGLGEIPIGINVSEAPKIKSTQAYPSATPYYGILNNSKNLENAKLFLTFLWTN